MGQIPGVYLASAAFTLSLVVQAVWLAYRSRPERQQLAARDAVPEALPAFSD
jgi:hypothetical protein